MRLAHATWPEVGAAIVLVPVGATEQHGPHLPLSTDTDIAVALAERAARERPGTLVVAPALAYGSSGEHQAFAGTLSIGVEATTAVLVELCRSATCTFSRVVLVSCHGGNAEPVARAVRLLAAEGRRVLAWSPRWEGDAHAGLTETSIMLALAPDRVRLADARPGNVEPLEALLPRLHEAGVASVSRSGVLGDPSAATAEHGAALLRAATADLLATVDGF